VFKFRGRKARQYHNLKVIYKSSEDVADF